LDVAAAAAKVHSAVFYVAELIGRPMVQVDSSSADAQKFAFDSKGIEAFHRLQQRVQNADADFWQLLWAGSAEAWEQAVQQSFAAGMSLHLEESTLQYQVGWLHSS
jgi:hypothetical protein